MKITKLFEPITINYLAIRNRIVMPAMALFYTEDYTFSNRYRAFYWERARGGLGLMFIGPIAIDKVGSPPYMPGLFDDRNVEPLGEFIGELHRDTNAKIGIQLIHMGACASSRHTGIIPIAPSSLFNKFSREIPREMTIDDIEEVKEAYARAAIRAKEVGVDYLEILASGGYLIGEFLSPVTNHRNDQYGGSLEKRMRFGLEVINRVRQEVGQDFAMGIRVSGHDFVVKGNTNVESALFCIEAEQAGVDSINVTGGGHETHVPQIGSDVPAGAFLHLARGIKEKVSVPVFASNRLGDPLVAEKALRSGAADMICWGRPLLADPELPLKVQAGRINEIVPCIGCNVCFDLLLSDSPVCCTVNPRLGREADTEIKKAKVKKRIFVAGGGPAGMEFALIASQKGHDVALHERGEKLGGQINLIGAIPGKEEFLKAVRSLENRLEISGAKIRLKNPLTPEIIEEEHPDIVVVATGAKAGEISVDGVHQPNIVNAWDVLDGTVSGIGKRVVIIGGGATGCETALLVANLGAPNAEIFRFLVYHSADDFNRLRKLLYDTSRKITIVEVMGRMASNVGPSTRWTLLKSLKLMGVEFRTKTKILSNSESAVVVETEAGIESIPADTVIIAVGSKSVNALAGQVKRDKTKVITIGDAIEPRKIIDAVREGFNTALKV